MGREECEVKVARCSRLAKLYWSLALPILLTFVLVDIALWYFSPFLSLAYLALWILINFCEAYCCADLQCPNKGKICHPIGGFILSSFLYAWFFDKIHKKDLNKLNLVLEYGSTLLIVLIIIYPIYWLYEIDIIWALLYPLLCVFYAFLHFLLICPNCPVAKKCITKSVRKYMGRTGRKRE